MFFGRKKGRKNADLTVKTETVISKADISETVISEKNKVWVQIQQNIRRKETLSPGKKYGFCDLPPKIAEQCGRRTFFFAPRKASLTVEAAMILPVFFICMIALLQFGKAMETASRFSSALAETAERMAINTYAYENGEDGNLVTGVLSAAYAGGQVKSKSGDMSSVKNVNFLLSSFLKEDKMVDIVLTYRVKAPVGGIKIPGPFFLQKGSVRAWVGRSGSGGEGEGTDGKAETGQKVFVTEHGKVYHTDINCTYIKLSLKQVDKDSVKRLRNNSGEKYHSCEICGKKAGNNVYITGEGNRYHSSLACRGLKRTVQEVSMEEIGTMRPCSKCGGNHS
ncbi:MAG: pilus assembly protein [Lachnospiraceae bacterium]|nr:pilus assembly protein [Lachnospiraceae bacterium]MDD3794958.1 pilus assembly protein [Lachnospiraceae bacterium]